MLIHEMYKADVEFPLLLLHGENDRKQLNDIQLLWMFLGSTNEFNEQTACIQQGLMSVICVVISMFHT